jgi:hypothetical protein
LKTYKGLSSGQPLLLYRGWDMTMKNQKNRQEELFINQAAQLLLALSGIKPLPEKRKKKDLQLDSLELTQL